MNQAREPGVDRAPEQAPHLRRIGQQPDIWIVQLQDDGDVRSGLATDPEATKEPEDTLAVRHERVYTPVSRPHLL